MSEDAKTPKAKVELRADSPVSAVKPAQASQAGAGAGMGVDVGAPGAEKNPADATAYTRRVSSWVSRTFPGHEKAFWGGVCGLLVALILFAIGLLRTIIVVVLVGLGVALGQMADGDPKLVKLVRKFFSGVD